MGRELRAIRVGQQCGTCRGWVEYRLQGRVERVGSALRQPGSNRLAGLLGLLIMHAKEAGQRSTAVVGGTGQRRGGMKGACVGHSSVAGVHLWGAVSW